ncbi:MAG: hypothetical protein WDO17_03340 [Alphaproteobacteria bacterium]
MKSVVILTSCALLALSAGTATAGPCTSEIDSVAKILAAKDAGQGPTGGNATGMGQPPTAAMSKADTSTAASNAAAKSGQPQQPPTAAMTSAATNLPTNSATKGDREHPPTAAMNAATQGSAASPQDVQRQTSGQPTAAQQAHGGASSHDGQTASAALEQARTFDRAGQEAQCMDAARYARQLAGS